ncbi:MAG: hypothetical protein RL417_147 [Pseudomonadota bacterium]
MADLQSAQRAKLSNYLKGRAPYSVVDRGIDCAIAGRVIECSRSGSTIHGVVEESDGNAHTVNLQVTSRESVDSLCSCSDPEEMNEQWCHHSVALLWRASDLGFLESESGFVSRESTFRINPGSPEEIAAVVAEMKTAHPTLIRPFHPTVSLILHLHGDRLGVKVFFDGAEQTPGLFHDFEKKSDRALDNILLQVLEDEGTWDEENRLWFVSSSRGIEIISGIAQEYSEVVADNGRRINFERELLEARLSIHWLSGAAELSMEWILPNGSVEPREGDLLGTGPHWTVLGQSLYRISSNASRISSIFPHASTLTLPRSRVGPILEAIGRSSGLGPFIHIVNPELQPSSEVAQPTPVLELERREDYSEHFASRQKFEIRASLDFEYPTPAEEQNIVYLPDRVKEQAHIEHLRSLGFEFQPEHNRFAIGGDRSLDLISKGATLFPDDWRLSGLESISKGVRFSKLALNISINTPEGAKRGPIDWFDCSVTLIQNNAHLPLSTLFKTGYSESDRWVRLDNGSFAEIPGGGLTNLKTTLGMLDPNFRLSNTLKTRLSTAQAIGFSRIQDEQFNIVLDNRLKTLSRKLKDFKSVDLVPVSKKFHGKLRSYQHEGLSWLNFLGEFELGGILADEMGLGKTVQTLAYIQHLKDSKSKLFKGPALVVAPTSVITNWLYEARRFTPGLKTLLLHGIQRRSAFETIKDYDVVITSYALLRLDRPHLEKNNFSYIILDEAQNIKNPDAATTKAAKALKAGRRVALTGTPTEKRPMELWSIMDFLMPGYLGSGDFFRNYIERPILEGGPAVQVGKFLNAKTRPFILRRTKAEVEKDLPPKIESTLHVEMTKSQRELYGQILEEVRPKVFDAVNKLGVKRATVSILAALLRLRQVCNHPNSIDALKELPGYDSGKFQLLKDLTLEALESGRKILLFGQFREMLSIIRGWLDEAQINHLYLDGTTRDRQSLVDKFNSDPEVKLFLISLKAGGTGLNLTAADTVIIYDPWWNPAVENQAVDRAHRIGQTKTVSVYRLVTEDSIEQKIMDLKSRKAKIVDALINENGLSTLSLSKRDLEDLFSPLPSGEGSEDTPSGE